MAGDHKLTLDLLFYLNLFLILMSFNDLGLMAGGTRNPSGGARTSSCRDKLPKLSKKATIKPMMIRLSWDARTGITSASSSKNKLTME